MSRGGVEITPVAKGRKRISDYRLRFNGEIRSAKGVWTEDQCRAFADKFWSFLKEQGATYDDWVILVTPKKREEGSVG